MLKILSVFSPAKRGRKRIVDFFTFENFVAVAVAVIVAFGIITDSFP